MHKGRFRQENPHPPPERGGLASRGRAACLTIRKTLAVERQGGHRRQPLELFNYIIHNQNQGSNYDDVSSMVSFGGLVDLLDALEPDPSAEGGLLYLFAVSLRDELLGVMGRDR